MRIAWCSLKLSQTARALHNALSYIRCSKKTTALFLFLKFVMMQFFESIKNTMKKVLFKTGQFLMIMLNKKNSRQTLKPVCAKL